MAPKRIYFLIPIYIFVYLLLTFRSRTTDRSAALGTPGIGISLTASYAVISLRKEDESFEDVGRIDGDQSYVELMQRLSTREAQHLR